MKIYRAKGMAWMSLKPEGLQCSFAKFLTEAQIAEIQKLHKLVDLLAREFLHAALDADAAHAAAALNGRCV